MDYIGETALSTTAGNTLMRFPAALGRSLKSAGYTRVKIYFTKDGILLKPYAGDRAKKLVELPKWDDE